MKLLLAGASGRMGQAIQEEAAQNKPAITLLPVPREISALPKADVLVDFTRPERTLELADLAVAAHTPMVSGTTGLTPEQFNALHSAATEIPILWAANMSIGVNLLLHMVKQAAAQLDESYDIDIFDMHHRHKVDSPSGTALALGQAAASGRNQTFKPVTDRDGKRPNQSIGYAVARGGGVIGEHSVMFTSDYERIELSHTALDRRLFARGAITAARWLISQKPGFYSMQDVIAGKRN
jgi:4-hydroxy-tetrahydrodipicolinate reductase